VFLLDFCQTEEEVKILNRENYAVNMVLTLKEIPV